METRIVERPAFRLVGHAARVPLVHRGVNPHIQAHIEALPAAEHQRLKGLGDTEPVGLLQVSADVDPDYAVGSVSHVGPLSGGVAGDMGRHRERLVPVQSLAAATGSVDRGRPGTCR